MTPALARRSSSRRADSPAHGGEYARRGACPGLSSPMATGDGWLVRLIPVGTIAPEAFAVLCAAAREHGNGVIEITARGSIQVRGLSAASVPHFVAAVAGLGIAAQDGVPVLTNALAGVGAGEIMDAGALAADLRRAFERSDLAERLGAKVSVTIEGGGAPDLSDIAADVRLSAMATDDGVLLRVGVGGAGADAAWLGLVSPARAVEAAIRLVAPVAARGRDARARDVVAAEGVAPFRATLHDLLVAPERAGEGGDAVAALDRRGVAGDRFAEAIGMHRLRGGSLACGVGLAFGHAGASSLQELVDAATATGASGLRAAPGRALIVIGLTRAAAASCVVAAERLGFIVRADDPRRRVVACAGAPVCTSAHIAARAMAPHIAQAVAALRDPPKTIHISGCAKGCAHPAPAALTIVGTASGCALVADGSARDAPFALAAENELPAAIADALSGDRRV